MGKGQTLFLHAWIIEDPALEKMTAEEFAVLFYRRVLFFHLFKVMQSKRKKQ